MTKASKIFAEDDAIRGLKLAATHGESITTIPTSAEERAVPIFKYLDESMALDTQLEFLKYLDWTGSQAEQTRRRWCKSFLTY